MEAIQSKENSLIKSIKKLKEKKYRLQQGAFIIEGIRFVLEALKSDAEVSYVFITEEVFESEYGNKIRSIISKDTKFYYVTSQIIKELSSTDNPQGIVAVVSTKENKIPEGDGFYVLADKIQDPGNFGTIIRSAHAAGAKAVIYTKGTVDLYNEKTLRSTMGSVFNIPVIEDADLNLMRQLKMQGVKVVVSSLDTDNNFFDVDLTGNVIICIGNEGKGISDEVISLADEKVKIPMPGNAESLNASIAASIMIFEVVRQNLLK